MRQLFVAFFCAVILAFGFTNAHSAKRIALIIGNSAYQNVAELQNPKNDAIAMSKKLASLDFEVIEGIDLDHAAMRKTVRQFISKLDGAELALFFYAGHGLQVNGNNYMAPIDASLRNQYDLEFETIPMNLILSAMEQNVKTNMVFLDACRDNPLATNLARSMGTRSAAVGRGLASLGSGIGTFVSFSTQPGNVALDGNGINSPYTTALIKHLGTPGEDLTRNMINVRRAVLKATNGKQVPWEHSSLTGEVVLKEKPKPVLKPAPKPKVAEVVKPASPPKADNTVELAYWDSIQNSNAEYFEIYLKRYPKGLFADIAHLKINHAKDRMAREAKARTIQKNTKPETNDTKEKAVEIASLNPETEESLPTKNVTRSVQRELNRLGCSAGTADGIWGKGSQKALKQYGRYSNVKSPALEPSTTLLDQLKAQRVRVCPLTCRSGFEKETNKCVRVKREASVDRKVDVRKKATTTPPRNTGKKTASTNKTKRFSCLNLFSGRRWIARGTKHEIRRRHNGTVRCKEL